MGPTEELAAAVRRMDASFFPCRGGKCDSAPRCNSAGCCTYKSSAEEARTLIRNESTPEGRKIWEDVDKAAARAAYRAASMLVLEAPKTIGITQEIRSFETGATRSLDTDKPDYEAFLSPLVLERYAEYMHKNRFQRDGSIRDGDNWQKGIPLKSYMKSGWRHFMAWWKGHRGLIELSEDDLCALLFNIQGYLHEHLKAKRASK